MGNARGLRTRLCPNCKEITPHRTLYVKAEPDGRTKWFPLFWNCTKCSALNHVTFPRYRLESAYSRLPSTLTVAVVKVLQGGPLDFGELVASLRRTEIQKYRHVFDSEVAMALEFLKGRGVVAEEVGDRTERTLDELRAGPGESGRLGSCPREKRLGVARKDLIPVYSQRRISTTPDCRSLPDRMRRFVRIGEFCIHCGYCQLNPRSNVIEIPSQQS